MKMRTATDLDLRNMLRDEMNKLIEYEEMFDHMTAEEKEELREWMAHGNSVNNNPYLLYGENGCLMDLIAARRTSEEMAAHPERFGFPNSAQDKVLVFVDDDEPF